MAPLTLTDLFGAVTVVGLMIPGARSELTREIRSHGTRYTEVAASLNVAIVVVAELPTNDVFLLDPQNGILMVARDDDLIFSIWAGLARFVAVEFGFEIDAYEILDVAAALCRSSGVMPRVVVCA